MIDFQISEYNAFVISSTILCIGIFIDSLNVIFKRHLYSIKTGIFPLKFQRNYRSSRVLNSIYDLRPNLFTYNNFIFLMIVRALIALIITLNLSNHFIFYILLFLLQLIFNIRNIFTLSGADQMQNIILFGLVIYSLNISP